MVLPITMCRTVMERIPGGEFLSRSIAVAREGLMVEWSHQPNPVGRPGQAPA